MHHQPAPGGSGAERGLHLRGVLHAAPHQLDGSAPSDGTPGGETPGTDPAGGERSQVVRDDERHDDHSGGAEVALAAHAVDGTGAL